MFIVRASSDTITYKPTEYTREGKIGRLVKDNYPSISLF